MHIWTSTDKVISCCIIAATSEEYKLLQQLNQITLAKYTDMCTIAHRLNEVSTRVNDNCELSSCYFHYYVVVGGPSLITTFQ